MTDKKHRRELEKYTKVLKGIPLYLQSTVNMLRLSFPLSLEIDSENYFALWSFLENEQFTNRAIATVMDYAFDLNYLEVLNSYGGIPKSKKRDKEIERIKNILEKFGLEEWRNED